MSASGAIPNAALVLIELETGQGITGRSYGFGYPTWTPKATDQSIEAMSEMLKGDPAAPLEIEAKLRKRLMLLGTPGLATSRSPSMEGGTPYSCYFLRMGVGLVHVDSLSDNAGKKKPPCPLATKPSISVTPHPNAALTCHYCFWAGCPAEGFCPLGPAASTR
jgi:hypothetical protein